jgi:hypothetical protein
MPIDRLDHRSLQAPALVSGHLAFAETVSAAPAARQPYVERLDLDGPWRLGYGIGHWFFTDSRKVTALVMA